MASGFEATYERIRAAAIRRAERERRRPRQSARGAALLRYRVEALIRMGHASYTTRELARLWRISENAASQYARGHRATFTRVGVGRPWTSAEWRLANQGPK